MVNTGNSLAEKGDSRQMALFYLISQKVDGQPVTKKELDVYETLTACLQPAL